MDIDDFKKVNDRYGHQTGDRILSQFAELMKKILPKSSIIARIGGDEFVVFLDSVQSETDITEICSSLQENAHSIHMGTEHITISIGAVIAHKEEDYDTLYRLSDSQMYKAKRNHKDQFCYAKTGRCSAGVSF